MHELKSLLNALPSKSGARPFSVITAVNEQFLMNVPIIKPLLICILGGVKELGQEKAICHPGDFVFLSNTPNIDMRNISDGSHYQALLIEFEYQDFTAFQSHPKKSSKYFTGKMTPLMSQTLQQFIEWTNDAPESMWHLRRQEILQLLFHMGHHQVGSIMEPPSLTHRVEQIVQQKIAEELSADQVAGLLAMSDSTLRRKLSSEGTHFQAIKDRIKLGNGLYLLQSSSIPIGLIAEQCGYQSQSRFTDKFKSLFGLTPSELRKTRMPESGE